MHFSPDCGTVWLNVYQEIHLFIYAVEKIN